MAAAKILAFAGSARKESFNKKLVKIAVEGAKKAGVEVTYKIFETCPYHFMIRIWSRLRVACSTITTNYLLIHMLPNELAPYN
ncbi:hypothetical protein DSM106972_052280 [Dulcicalothrix desertica PCC 7102]|uniref:NADPH-dependent FMN reductase-like domain-containing protein n=1 Tax=Dulcicalothrix desertica PCC 7102 TaxID=232991 RepID=A0A3S1CHN3_9CYAN|nr:NAD(P)H-dependent oxidoreductase [Dulcicalothrix desertica]RUT03589.1 hypothetical protein DSM106972_052280 [Dulcicalothrix desertica PCC 7102]TWH50487.1 putative flavoprotein [Dulcicalothrix desertica PCC 7102]